jgi:succinylglutamic semialdehyde dehydrogenase
MTTSPAVLPDPADLIGDAAIPIPGAAIRTHNPAHPLRPLWAFAPVAAHVDRAVHAARHALPIWSRWPIEKRAEALLSFKAAVAARTEQIAHAITTETGKPWWDSLAEAKLLAGKVDITLEHGPHSGRHRVSPFDVKVTDTRAGKCAFRPHGVMAVIGPFNFPAHLPNGHIIPALLAGNTVVFKPSDKAPASGQLLADALRDALSAAGAPPGVVNCLHGAGDTARALTSHHDIDGILFTGSWPVGRAILEANLDNPGRMIALEMGGNNAALVMDDADPRQAAIECIRAAFVSAGQRCTCTRRLLIHRAIAPTLIPLLQKVASELLIGDPMGLTPGTDAAPAQPVFMGPVVRAESRDAVLRAQSQMLAANGRTILEATAIDHPSGGHYISPGIIEVERFVSTGDIVGQRFTCAGDDAEVFGPLLRIALIDSFDDGIAQVNATRFGLAASIFTQSPALADRFVNEARAGCINVNTGTAGASSKLPFGGLGLSGNHRPAAAFSLDYCAYPVASLVESTHHADLLPGMRFDDAWLK